jgi:lipopolysaccharide export LptBFGC system permease protein LptF
MASHSSSSSSLKHKIKGDGTIQICCSWGKEIDDGILIYRIADDANPQVIQAVHQAVDEWNSKVPNIQLQEVTDSDADIDIKTNSKASKVNHDISSVIGESRISAGKNIKLVAPGEAQISFDRRGFITHVDVTLSTKAHGHTNFIGDLMSPVLTDNTNTDISQCDINGIEEANTSPHDRVPQFLRC